MSDDQLRHTHVAQTVKPINLEPAPYELCVGDRLIILIKTGLLTFGSGSKKASHSLRRKKQFALIVPATKTRIDLGLALKGEEATRRLEIYNAMCSHRVRLENEQDFDEEVKNWIKEAYARAG